MNYNIPISQVLLITKANRNQPKNQITHRSFGFWVVFYWLSIHNADQLTQNKSEFGSWICDYILLTDIS
ncbi:hypothetical protein AO369_0850 [Moraxella catarrhalis]|nr:hypothetical protein AO369_0850 [Moraxella catarrhalis]